MFFNAPYSRHQKIADSFYSGKIEVYKSKSTSDIIEISTMDWLEQLVVVIRWTIIWIGTPYLTGWVTCTNYQTFLLWKAWKHACNNLCVVRLFTLFHFFFSCFQVRNWAGSHSVGNFLWGCWLHFNSLFFIFHLSDSYFRLFGGNFSFSAAFPGGLTAVQCEQFHLPADCYCVVSLLKNRNMLAC